MCVKLTVIVGRRFRTKSNNEIFSLPASASKLIDDQSEKERAESEARTTSRLSMLSTYQRKRLENETGEEYSARLAKYLKTKDCACSV